MRGTHQILIRYCFLVYLLYTTFQCLANSISFTGGVISSLVTSWNFPLVLLDVIIQCSYTHNSSNVYSQISLIYNL